MITDNAFPAVVFSVTDAGIAELEAKHRGLVVVHRAQAEIRALESKLLEREVQS